MTEIDIDKSRADDREPDVSVVIPTRDRPGYLARALQGATNQQGVSAEVIVVDDGSSPPAAAHIASNDGLRVVRRGRPGGVADARNAGVECARAEWVAFLDDDDVWAPHKLRTQLDAARAQSADWIYSSAFVLDARLSILREVPAPDPAALAGRLRFHNQIPGGGSGVLARTELVRRIGGFDGSVSPLEDWDLWLRLSATAAAAVCREPLVGSVLHDESSRYDTDRLLTALERFGDKHLGDPERREFAVRTRAPAVAFSHRRAGRRWLASREYMDHALRHRSGRLMVRSIGVLFGERAMRGGTVRRTGSPDWLLAYRSGP